MSTLPPPDRHPGLAFLISRTKAPSRELAASHIMGGAGHHDRRHHGAHGTAGAITAL
jgi:hypothetical protein